MALLSLAGNQEHVIPSGVVPRGISRTIKEIPRRILRLRAENHRAPLRTLLGMTYQVFTLNLAEP
ncbi:hypothetical protein HY772_08075 [Candidatus Woesearchaeota archaeon]|nr:hypothetical protein [Candidatus Woesearchaeota archaeon]